MVVVGAEAAGAELGEAVARLGLDGLRGDALLVLAAAVDANPGGFCPGGSWGGCPGARSGPRQGSLFPVIASGAVVASGVVDGHGGPIGSSSVVNGSPVGVRSKRSVPGGVTGKGL